MSGIQEILVLIIIILGILFLPRILKPGGTNPDSQGRGRPPLPIYAKIAAISGRLRLAIVVSILLPFGAALYFEPWHRGIIPFIAIGVGPVALFWGTFWVVSGYKNSGK